jgi:hypothetical protein
MKTITHIVVSVAIQHKDDQLAQAEVHIPIETGQRIRAQHLTDACQRSVAHCIDELNKELDISR